MAHGILAPRAKWRAAAVAYGRADAAAMPDDGAPTGGPPGEAATISVAIPLTTDEGVADGRGATAGVLVAPAPVSDAGTPQPSDAPPGPAPPRRWRWAELLQRVFAVDVLACPNCGGRMRVISTSTTLGSSGASSRTSASRATGVRRWAHGRTARHDRRRVGPRAEAAPGRRSPSRASARGRPRVSLT